MAELWPLVEGVAREVGLLDNLRTITTAIRKAGIRIFIVPHHRWEPGDYEGFRPSDPPPGCSGKMQSFAKERTALDNKRSRTHGLREGETGV